MPASLFGRAKSGGQIIGAAIAAFKKYPKLLIPLLFSWIFYSGIIVYFNLIFDWKALGLGATLAVSFSVVFSFSSILCFSASWLLEMIEQIETGKPPRTGAALRETIKLNLIRTLPIAFSWATIWFLLILVDVLTSKRKSGSSANRELTIKNATNLLIGTGSDFSWTKLSLEMIKKLVRMLVFLSLPAVCWRDMTGLAAMKEGIQTARLHAVEFFAGYMLSGAMAALVFLPAALPAYLDTKGLIHIPESGWPVIFVYLAFAWSFSIYIEQMFTAELYLWHLKWEAAVENAKRNGTSAPELSEVRRPSLIDDLAELV